MVIPLFDFLGEPVAEGAVNNRRCAASTYSHRQFVVRGADLCEVTRQEYLMEPKIEKKL